MKHLPPIEEIPRFPGGIPIRRAAELRLLYPVRPGESFAKGWRLVSVSGIGVLEYGFEHEGGESFVLGLQPKGRAPRPFVSGRLVDYYLNASSGVILSASAERLAQAMARLLEEHQEPWETFPFFGPTAQQIDDRRANPRLLSLKVTGVCNHHCLFCSDRPSTTASALLEDMVDHLVVGREEGRYILELVAMEPTLHKEILPLIQKAHELGYTDIRMVTNGSRIAKRAFLAALMDAGLIEVGLSFHGHDESLESLITGQKRSFGWKSKAAKNLFLEMANRRLSGVEGLLFKTTSCVSLLNLESLADLVRLLLSFGPDRLAMNLVEPAGMALKDFDRVIPDPRLLKEPLAEVARLADESETPLELLDFPLCVLPQGLGQGNQPMRQDRFNAAGQWISETTRIDKAKAPACASCVLKDRCAGLWRLSLEAFGPECLTPIRNESPA